MIAMRSMLALSAAVVLVGTAPGALAARDDGSSEPQAEQGSTRTLYLMLIRQARDDGRARAALAYLDDFERQHPGDREAQLLRVNCLLDLGQIDAADAALQRMSKDAGAGDVLAARGHIAAARNDWASAVKLYAQARSLRPTDALIGNALGFAQMQMREPVLAVETLRGALDLMPGNQVIRNNLGLALTAAGYKAQADALLSGMADVAERTRLRSRFASEALVLSAPLAPNASAARP